MCIAIYKPKGVLISKDTLAQCFRANPDGAGYMFNLDKKLIVKKGFFTFDEFWEQYQQDENNQCVIHFRIKTHGKINIDNCHPFLVTPNIGFIHNGIISGLGSGDNSDTYEFNEVFMKHLVTTFGKRVIRDTAIKALVEDFIGYSKLVFLDNYGNFEIFNEEKGGWDEGVWYSNASYKIPKVTHVQRYTGHIPNRPTIEFKKKVIHGKEEWYISRYSGEDIHVGDWVELGWDNAAIGLERGEWVNVLDINKEGRCKIETTEGKIYHNIAGACLYHPITN